MKNGKDFEQLIENIYKILDKTSVISKNDKVYGYDSKQNREIDISIRTKVGIHPILMIIQARDYAQPVDINDIGEFYTVIKDVRASKGILISAKGFTKGALQLAETYRIETLTAHDSRNPKWKLNINLPVVLSTHIGDFNLAFKFSATDEYVEKVVKPNRNIQMPKDFLFRFTPDKGKTIVIPIEEFRKLYLSNRLIPDGNEYKINFDKNLELIVEDGLYVPATDLHIEYSLTRKLYYKYFELTEFQGLVNKMTRKINPAHFKLVANEFTVENWKVQNRKQFSLENWTPIEDTTTLTEPFKINLYHFPKLKQRSPVNLQPCI